MILVTRRSIVASNKTRLVIDCSYLCYKAFYVGSRDLSYEEKTTGVMFSFLMQVFKLARTFDTRSFVFCWDSGKRYRRRIYPEYKMKRQELTEQEKEEKKVLYSQVNELRVKVLPRMGFRNNFIETGHEADDLIAQIVMDNGGCVVVSGDKDLYQLLDRCDLYLSNGRRFTMDDFVDLYGIIPPKWVLAKAMGGCDSDEVPGIQGVGDPAKSTSSKALSYLRGELTSGVVFDRIESDEGQEVIRRNLKLVGLPFSGRCKRKLDFDEVFAFADWIDLFNRYGFRSFIDKKYLNRLKEVFELV
jgi:DNA polymerase-1